MKNNTGIRSLLANFAVLLVLIAVPSVISPVCCGQTVKEAPVAQESQPAASDWVSLFNGKDLSGWTPKILGHQLGDNYADTFRVEDGVLKISYDKYVDADFKNKKGEPKFEKFGHLFYKDSFSNYDLRVEYRFVGDQVKNGPGWAFRNNGLMVHGQDPATMPVDQSFPVSIEVQLLGARENQVRHTLNLCTPGTNVVMNGKLFKPHCTSSNSPSFPGDQWVTVLIEVRGNKSIKHIVNKQVVLEYTEPQLDPRDGTAKPLIKAANGNLMLSSGTISLQSESHPTEFRKIEIRDLGKTKK